MLDDNGNGYLLSVTPQVKCPSNSTEFHIIKHHQMCATLQQWWSTLLSQYYTITPEPKLGHHSHRTKRYEIPNNKGLLLTFSTHKTDF